ncbi:MULTISPECIES: tyrosine--tRNA ligase [Tepidanaerobacter]|uniref:Tyrosine--tRNA ligase n=3 Tax=Tepidanaerobacter syntrophicus TaxID=224999 RepID=A0A0U9HIJ0_9FIRM|nr:MULTISPECIES: tyrosine--tRNA ligase [Tepidanaerobacter]GAQ24083.1 tyrosyl-tRNA synthetase [Tepidanaerobacter syntrophicus]GLI19533.1 tyrosine--tRNA ligase [Tepidanaerobacter syntrophicus]GLI51733.1 tyrosine--tRNA ligase [Tepidanaerobacter syntrophicus]HHV82379.1 tyrosine--tRNA ligase [Tepidanaerobacter syntrophicus]
MENAYDILKERGFIEQATHEEEIRELLEREKVVFYVGFDPTADSLHVGHLLPMMAMAHMQRAGHTPIALLGGGTAMVGDPSGRTDMRKMLTREQIDYNASRFKEQFKRLLDFSDNKAYMLNNADWLLELKYIDFLREIGSHFSVNRMLAAECYKQRLESGLTFLEFNYMVMQSYDFLYLYRNYGCKLQMGGNDQWSNIISGADLIRRVEGGSAYGMTFTLLTTSEGIKMGKTQAGALWLDPEKVSPYDFYQYWRNVDDRDVEKCLKLLTFLPMEEIKRLSSLEGAEINKAKEVLAFEITSMIHGKEEAEKAQEAARALFKDGTDTSAVPYTEIDSQKFAEGMDITELLLLTGLVSSKSEGRRLIQQGGIYIGESRVDDIGLKITMKDFDSDKTLLLRKGKKVYHIVKLI